MKNSDGAKLLMGNEQDRTVSIDTRHWGGGRSAKNGSDEQFRLQTLVKSKCLRKWKHWAEKKEKGLKCNYRMISAGDTINRIWKGKGYTGENKRSVQRGSKGYPPCNINLL